MPCSVACVLSSYFNSDASISDLNEKLLVTSLKSISNQTLTNDCELNVYILASNELLLAEIKLKAQYYLGKTPVNLISATQANLSKELEVILGSFKEDYICFWPIGTKIYPNFIANITPWLQRGVNGIKATVVDIESELPCDLVYEHVLENKLSFFYHGFHSLILKRSLLEQCNFAINLQKHQYLGDIELCQTLRESFSTIGLYFDISTKLSKYLATNPEQITQAKNVLPFVNVSLCEISFPKQVFATKEQLQIEITRTMLFYRSCTYLNLDLYSLSLLKLITNIRYCETSELKNILALNLSKLYKFVCGQLVSQGRTMQQAQSSLDKALDRFTDGDVGSAVRKADVFDLMEQAFLYSQKSVKGIIKDQYNEKKSLALINNRLLGCLNNLQNKVCLAESLKAVQEVQIHIVSVVNNPALYDKLFYQNVCVNWPNMHLHPMLNPDPNEPERIFGLSEAYNRFLNQFDYSKESWLIFCHNDLEFKDDITAKLANLDQNCLYGMCGARVTQKQDQIDSVLVGDYIKHYPNLNFSFHCCSANAAKDKKVDTLDCFCLIMHSSLVERYALRFDENLLFDLVVEDMCINAWLQHNIPSYLLDILVIHHSNASPNVLPLSYYASLKYLNKKYPNISMAGSTSMLGGGVPQDKLFK